MLPGVGGRFKKIRLPVFRNGPVGAGRNAVVSPLPEANSKSAETERSIDSCLSAA